MRFILNRPGETCAIPPAISRDRVMVLDQYFAALAVGHTRIPALARDPILLKLHMSIEVQ